MSYREQEVEDSPFAEPERRPRRREFKKPRHLMTEWEIQAERWSGPKCWFDCGGIRWGFAFRQTMETALEYHRKMGHEPVVVA
jgi:hypothetical protein